jgi:hypothetical protein
VPHQTDGQTPWPPDGQVPRQPDGRCHGSLAVGQAGRGDGRPAASQQCGDDDLAFGFRRWQRAQAGFERPSAFGGARAEHRRAGFGRWNGAVGLETVKAGREQCFQARCISSHQIGFRWLRWKEWLAVTLRSNVTESESVVKLVDPSR